MSLCARLVGCSIAGTTDDWEESKDACKGLKHDLKSHVCWHVAHSESVVVCR